MPPIQHTFGTTGNMPSHPGAGITQTPQNGPLQTNNPYFSQPTPSPSTLPVPPPPPPPPSSETNKAEEQQQYTSSSSPPSSFPIAVSSSHNYAHESTYPQVLSTYAHESTYPQPAPHTTYAQNPYNNYNDASQLPQEPIPAYTRDVQNDSPDLLAARREYIDVETQIQNETTELKYGIYP
ncbi:hypothetical protein TWF173_011531 [Orbilia oligospora]|nr:hypothetical protein TWF173_011531 [Orbilia oligospora]